MRYHPIAFKVEGRVSLKDFERMWDDLADMGVSLRLDTFEFAGGFLYVEGDIPENWQTAREVKEFCARTEGIEIDAETMRDWY